MYIITICQKITHKSKFCRHPYFYTRSKLYPLTKLRNRQHVDSVTVLFNGVFVVIGYSYYGKWLVRKLFCYVHKIH